MSILGFRELEALTHDNESKMVPGRFKLGTVHAWIQRCMHTRRVRMRAVFESSPDAKLYSEYWAGCAWLRCGNTFESNLVMPLHVYASAQISHEKGIKLK